MQDCIEVIKNYYDRYNFNEFYTHAQHRYRKIDNSTFINLERALYTFCLYTYFSSIVSFVEHPSAFIIIFFSDPKFVSRYCFHKNSQSFVAPSFIAVQ